MTSLPHHKRTPCFSEDTCAYLQVLRSFTGSDYSGFSATIPAGASLVEPGCTPKQPVTLAWTTYRQMAVQAGTHLSPASATVVVPKAFLL